MSVWPYSGGVTLVIILAIGVPLTMFGRLGSFACGAVAGAFLAQNYKIPNVSEQLNKAITWIHDWERDFKKNQEQRDNTDASKSSSSVGSSSAPKKK